MRGWQANKRRIYAQPVKVRVIPENEIPPAMRVDIYLWYCKIVIDKSGNIIYTLSYIIRIVGSGYNR